MTAAEESSSKWTRLISEVIDPCLGETPLSYSSQLWGTLELDCRVIGRGHGAASSPSLKVGKNGKESEIRMDRHEMI